ncbi:hypothetical protein AGMMS49574_22070 [Bacteroidia bacterium]|nr:hypothetical protein AGMMS49574_22070 [Bacteroidia bacterium]
MDEKKKNNKKKERRFSLLYILGGGILKEDFILKHTRMILLVVLLTLFFIGNRYSCIQKMKQIDRLQEELYDMQLEALTLSVDLAKYSRLSQIEELIKRQDIDLEGATKPPYILYK